MTGKKLHRAYRVSRYVLYRETMVNPKEILGAFFTSFLGIGIIGFLQSQYLAVSDNLFLIGSFGASAVLIYGIPTSPLAKPRNVIGGHLVCALIGVAVYRLLGGQLWLASAFAVSLSIVAMQVTKTLHPPGGATGLIACIGSAKITSLGYWYVICPVMSGVLLLVLVAILTNKDYAKINKGKYGKKQKVVLVRDKSFAFLGSPLFRRFR